MDSEAAEGRCPPTVRRPVIRMRPTAMLVPILLASIASVGCGSGDDPEPAGSTATTVSSTPTTVSVAELAGQYLEITGPGNDAGKVFEQRRTSIAADAASFSDIGALADRLADAAEPFAAVLEEGTNRLARLPWSESMRRHVDALVTARTAIVGDLRSARSARSSDSYLALFERLTANFSSASAAANLLRADLGLPPPGQDPTTTTVGAAK